VQRASSSGSRRRPGAASAKAHQPVAAHGNGAKTAASGTHAQSGAAAVKKHRPHKNSTLAKSTSAH
jgi:hypothetical protein